MIRRLIVLAAVAAMLALARVLGLDHPATVPASALAAAHARSRQRQGDVLRSAAARPATRCPSRTTSTKLGGGLALNSPFGTFYVPNISPDPKDGIGGWSEAQFVTAMTKGTSPSGEHLYPGVSLYLLSAHAARRPARSVRLSQDAAGGAGPRARSRPAVPVQYPAHARAAGSCCFSTASRSQPDPCAVGAMESRRLSGQRTRPLRRMSFAAQCARRRDRTACALPAGRARTARRRSQHHPVQAQGLDGGRYRRHARPTA